MWVLSITCAPNPVPMSVRWPLLLARWWKLSLQKRVSVSNELEVVKPDRVLYGWLQLPPCEVGSMEPGEKKPPFAVFSFLEAPIKTIAYVDGFNLYFGSLRGTPYRWLDLCALIKRLCHEQTPACELVAIKYFTADIKAKLQVCASPQTRKQVFTREAEQIIICL